MSLWQGLKDQVLGWGGIALACLLAILAVMAVTGLIALIGLPAFIVAGFVLPFVISAVVSVVFDIH